VTEVTLGSTVMASVAAMTFAPESDSTGIAYDERLAARIMTVITESPRITFLDLVRRCEGAYPGLVAQVLANHGLKVDVQPKGDCSPAVPRTPELSPARSEWYFTQDTALALQDLIGDCALVVGTPTIAEAASVRGASVTLVDNSPWIGRRCQLGRVTWHETDFACFKTKESYANIVLDPPWYFPELTAWLDKALRLVPIGGRVLMPLFRELTRPTAFAERLSIIELAQTYGDVCIVPQIVGYETPLYEQEALRVSGVPHTCPCPWRLADLLIVTRDNREMPAPPENDNQSRPFEWLEFIVKDQLISVRQESLLKPARSAVGGDLLTPVPGVTGWVLDSVSARDSRRNSIDIWTSRNRVAKLTLPAKAVELLRDLESGAARQSPDSKSNSFRAQELLSWLEV
jgi:hypothetical protein